MRGHPRGRPRASQAAEGDQPKAQGLGRPPGMEELRGFRQLPGESSHH